MLNKNKVTSRKIGALQFYFIIILIVLIIGCNKKESDTADNSDANKITGQSTAKIYRACKYDDGNFCEELCCEIKEKCSGSNSAYRQCNLETGEWRNSTFSDLRCSIECALMDLQEKPIINEQETKRLEETINVSTEVTTKNCEQGWKCTDNNRIKFQISNCSFTTEIYCERGCFNNSCAPLCKPGDFICKNKDLRICDDDGNHYSFYKECDYGCENGKCVEQNTTNQTIANQNEVNQTQNQSSQNETNQNQTPPPQNNDYITDNCIILKNFNYDAPGNDNSSNLNDEYFTLKNTCSYSIDMTNWIAKDAADHKFTFPGFNLGVNAEVIVHTGSGVDDSTNLYWGRGSHVWNNNGDTLYVNNSNGTSILIYSYP